MNLHRPREMTEGGREGGGCVEQKEDKNSAVAFPDSRTNEILIASTPSRGGTD